MKLWFVVHTYNSIYNLYKWYRYRYLRPLYWSIHVGSICFRIFGKYFWMYIWQRIWISRTKPCFGLYYCFCVFFILKKSNCFKSLKLFSYFWQYFHHGKSCNVHYLIFVCSALHCLLHPKLLMSANSETLQKNPDNNPPEFYRLCLVEAWCLCCLFPFLKSLTVWRSLSWSVCSRACCLQWTESPPRPGGASTLSPSTESPLATNNSSDSDDRGQKQ